MAKTLNDVNIVDIDDPTTWPIHIYKIVSQWAERCSGATNHTNELPLSLDDEEPFRELFTGYLLRAYRSSFCTLTHKSNRISVEELVPEGMIEQYRHHIAHLCARTPGDG
jgi:hypothetical protein